MRTSDSQGARIFLRDTALGLTALVWLAAAPSGAEPVDLDEPRPRPVEVLFEVSPPEAPGSLGGVFSDPAPAWLSPGDRPGRVRIRVEARALERVLRAFDPVPESFSDFVWVLDRDSGHVLSASFTGSVRRRLPLGPFSTSVRSDIDVAMSTVVRAGFLPGVERFGQLVFEPCRPGAARCTEVEPRRYDPVSGYVNAVGTIHARSLGWMEVRSFSPLGEAIFREVPEETPTGLPRHVDASGPRP